MKIDFDKMTACKNEKEGKQFNIKRKKGNKIEMNLMDFQYDFNEWSSIYFIDSDYYIPSSSIFWHSN